MVINLNESYPSAEIKRSNNQIETRLFILGRPIDVVMERYGDQKDIVEKLATKRSYRKIYNCAIDSHWQLEALGLGTGIKHYMNIIDTSGLLSLVLFTLYNVSVQFPEELSVAILENDMNLNYTLRDIFVNKEIFSKIYNRVMVDEISDDYELFLSKFYEQVINEINRIRLIILTEYKEGVLKSAIYRSKTSSRAILTSDVNVNEDIDFIYNGVTFSGATIRSYAPFEYEIKQASLDANW